MCTEIPLQEQHINMLKDIYSARSAWVRHLHALRHVASDNLRSTAWLVPQELDNSARPDPTLFPGCKGQHRRFHVMQRRQQPLAECCSPHLQVMQRVCLEHSVQGLLPLFKAKLGMLRERPVDVAPNDLINLLLTNTDLQQGVVAGVFRVLMRDWPAHPCDGVHKTCTESTVMHTRNFLVTVHDVWGWPAHPCSGTTQACIPNVT